MEGIHATLAESASATQRFDPLPPRLVKAAHEFEAQMMKELLKPMTESRSFTGDDEDSGSARHHERVCFGGAGQVAQ